MTDPTAGLRHSESILIARTPDEVYTMISDVTRMGEWSPVCRACWWDEGDGPQTGAWFTGRNETPTRTWETRAQVVTAEPGRTFAFTVGGGWVHWAYTCEPAPEGTKLTESWHFSELGLAGFHERYGDDAQAQIADRTRAAHEGIPATLAAIKRAAEGA
jgi:hypothetical protein